MADKELYNKTTQIKIAAKIVVKLWNGIQVDKEGFIRSMEGLCNAVKEYDKHVEERSQIINLTKENKNEMDS